MSEKNFVIALIFIIVCIGVAGNILNLIVLNRRSMRKLTTFRFLFYLAIVDLLVLLFCSVDMFIKFAFNVDIRTQSTAMCRFHTFTTYFLTHASSIMLMLVSVERLFIIWKKSSLELIGRRQEEMPLSPTCATINSFNTLIKPNKRKSFSRINHVEALTMAILIILAFINLHFLLYLNVTTLRLNRSTQSTTNESDDDYLSGLFASNNHEIESIERVNSNEDLTINACFSHNTNKVYAYILDHVWIWIDISLYCLIPYVVMSICSLTLFIIIKLESQKLVARLKNFSLSRKRSTRDTQIFVLLLANNIFFIMCTLPSSLIYYSINKGDYVDPNAYLMYHALSYSKNSLSFIIFGFFSRSYRIEMFKLFFKLTRTHCEMKH